MADCRELRETLGSAGNGTALRVIGSSRKYREVSETGEILTAIVNLQAANRELWPYDQVNVKEVFSTACRLNVITRLFLVQTTDFLWMCLHNYGFLRDVTNKGTQLEVMRDWFNAVAYQNAIRATENKAPLAYKVRVARA